MLADCLRDLTALGPGGIPALLGAMFLAGLAGGLTHCAGMCAPFVLAQAAARAGQAGGAGGGGGVLRRLSGAALLPYHLGRMLGYGALGAMAGGAAGLLVLASGLRAVLAALLVVAALMMLAAAVERVRPGLLARPWATAPASGGGSAWTSAMGRHLGPLLAAPTGGRGVLLGLVLSALPCGLLYGALAGAAASGSALGGALAMVAFVAGTVPSLVAVALVGRFFGRRHGGPMRTAAAVLFALNGVVLLGMAARLASVTA